MVMGTTIGIPQWKRKWFDKWSKSCDSFYESRKKYPTVD